MVWLKRGFLFSFLFFVSCASTPPVCQPDGARNAGVAAALRGEAYQEGPGAVCKDEQVAVFKAHYMAGYQQGRQQLCDPGNTERAGQAHAQAGGANQYNENLFKICDSKAGHKAAYAKGYQKGQDEFCGDAKAVAAGEARGTQGLAGEYADASYPICSKAKLGRIKSAYERGHRAGLAKFCTVDEVNAKGATDGAQGADKMDVAGRYQLCAPAKKAQILKAYDQAYDRGISQYCAEPNIEAEAVNTAKNSPSAALPAKYAKCFAKSPELSAKYQAAFNAERGRVIASRCTYNAGVESGKAAAQASNNKNTAMPDFCDVAAFQPYLTGYLEGWKQTKDRMCDVVAAYQGGMNQGQGGQPLSYNPPPNCPPEYEGMLRQKFTEGYQQGLMQRQSAAHSSLQSSAAATVQTGCRSSIDCPSGSFCRDRGDGRSYCMGKGRKGDFCSSSIDCGVGLFCREVNGLRQCL